ncbi:trigger factor [Aeromicrobium chenweiae]|uniref:Trigger factor n=1 Tax=Aeromicrobium chenweiae TaxID=2079793 RepID=A0A2S0WKB3_9ACTN|nr:trigger factor [Aeromicrobium chenweiae]AWB91680.1 trigger factor [Aeromicrobium chenweiae]TGN32520.1 trigger factor [Aeromicrobium chenweiae]
MKSTTETLSPTRVKLTIEVPFEEFKPSLDAAYKTIGSQITIPGFRKGKVPAAIVDQRIGRGAVLDEALNSALPGWYSQALQDTNVQPLSQPEIDLSKFEDGETIEVTAELDVRPELEIPDVSAIEVTVEDAAVTDEDIDEQLTALRERFATFAEVDRPVAEGDFLTIDLSAAQNGEEIPEAQAAGMPYSVGKATMLEGLDEAVIGLSAGESKTFTTQLVGGELAGQDVDVTVTVKDVKEQQLPELDEEFAQTASEFDTIEELKADLTDRVTRGKRMEQANEARDLVLDEIVSKIDAPLPESLVTEEIGSRRQQIEQQLAMAGVPFEQYLDDEKQTVDEFEAELEKRVRDSLVAQFVLDQVVANEEFGIDDSELSQHIMRRAQQSGEDPNSYIQHIMEHNHVPEMVSEVLRGKALASLVESAKVTDKSGNVIELSKLRADGTFAEDTEDDAEETPSEA